MQHPWEIQRSFACPLPPQAAARVLVPPLQSFSHPSQARRRASSRTLLRVVVLDTTPIVRAAAADRAVALEAGHEATAGTRRLVAAKAEAEENRGDEKSGPGTPDKPEGIATEGSGAAIVLEGVASLNEDSARVAVSTMRSLKVYVGGI